uniref:Tyramine receptor tyra-2 n=1 Tax=Ascaris suum TaxID=6253 RepID=F1LHE4_ASCSU
MAVHINSLRRFRFCRYILCSTASIWNLSIVGLDRYWAITSPVAYMSKRNKRTAGLMILSVWISSALISLALRRLVGSRSRSVAIWCKLMGLGSAYFSTFLLIQSTARQDHFSSRR